MPHSEDTQPGPAWCLATEDHNGIPYVCTYKASHVGRHKMVKKSDMRAELRDAMDAMTTAELEGDPTGLLPADPPTAAMQTMNELADITGLIAIDQRFDLLSYQAKTMIAVAQDVRVAKLALADDRPVDPAVIERIKKRVDGLLLQVGIHQDGGS